MKKPDRACLDAVRTLRDAHEGDFTAYYSLDDGCAVFVVTDQDLADKMCSILSLLSDTEIVEDIEGVPVITPDKPFEA